MAAADGEMPLISLAVIVLKYLIHPQAMDLALPVSAGKSDK